MNDNEKEERIRELEEENSRLKKKLREANNRASKFLRRLNREQQANFESVDFGRDR